MIHCVEVICFRIKLLHEQFCVCAIWDNTAYLVFTLIRCKVSIVGFGTKVIENEPIGPTEDFSNALCSQNDQMAFDVEMCNIITNNVLDAAEVDDSRIETY